MAAKFAELLKKTMGLDAASVGPSAVTHAVQERASACGLADTAAYWRLVQTSPRELEALTEAVVVPETWFFRDRMAFSETARIALQEWLPRNPRGLLRILSVPCSSGEEPYSIAMALLDSGFPVHRYRIDAIDISARSLKRAQLAEYGKNSFRGADLAFRERHFEAKRERYRLRDAVRQAVCFQAGNLLAAGFLSGAEVYDVIFCRNLLIYFDQATQDRAVQVLQRLLKVGGYLFVGPSEAGLLLNNNAVSAGMQRAFAFRKTDEGQSRTRRHITPSQRSSDRDKTGSRPSAPRESVAASRPSAAEECAGLGASVEEASALADQGRLVDAAKICEALLRRCGPSAQALHLMGLIRAAAGNVTEAAEYYRKTLYLDPHHEQSLIHLALLLEQQGDKSGAKVVRERLRRAARRE